MSTRREITRAATVAEIKSTALRLMTEQGSSDLRFADIAREMSMTGPALYRYFSGRDELIAALENDAFTQLADALDKALADVSSDRNDAAFVAVCGAYRSWALADRTRYALLFGAPVPGYVTPAHDDCDAGQRAFDCMVRAVADVIAGGAQVVPLGPQISPGLQSVLAHKPLGQVPPDIIQALMHAWAGIHGFVSLEAFGHLDWCAGPAGDELFDGLVRGLATYVGVSTAA